MTVYSHWLVDQPHPSLIAYRTPPSIAQSLLQLLDCSTWLARKNCFDQVFGQSAIRPHLPFAFALKSGRRAGTLAEQRRRQAGTTSHATEAEGQHDQTIRLKKKAQNKNRFEVRAQTFIQIYLLSKTTLDRPFFSKLTGSCPP